MCRVAEDSTRTVVPGQDVSRAIGGDDRLNGRLRHSGKAALGLFALGDFTGQGSVRLGQFSGPLSYHVLN